MSFSGFGIAIIISVGFLVGLSKSAIPGLVLILSPMLALIMPVRESTGFLLPILVAGDIMAVSYWKRKAHWPDLKRILPWSAAGVVVGFLLLGALDEHIFKPFLGTLIIVLTLLNMVRQAGKLRMNQKSPVFSTLLGFLAGSSTMMANAAAPVLAVYLLSLDLDKEDFVGTNAWYFLIMNIFKLPFSAALGLVTWQVLKVALFLVPAILAGGALGVFVLRRIPKKFFEVMVQALALASGLKLLF